MRLRRPPIFLAVAVLAAACSGTTASAPVTFAPGPVTATADASPAPQTPAVTGSLTPPVEPISGEVMVTMTDAMRFEPETITVRAGEPITFVVRNDGVIVHEFFVGTETQQAEHAVEMASGGMSHAHGNAVSVQAGQTASLTMTFEAQPPLLIGCHEIGHYEAGMVGTLIVSG